MTTIFKIQNGQCSIENQEAFEIFKTRASAKLLESMKTSLSTLPIDYRALHRSYVTQLFNEKAICTTLLPEIQLNGIDAKAARDKFKGSTTEPSVALKRGLVAYRTTLTLLDKCPPSFQSSSEYYTNNATCSDVKNAINSRQLPIVMYSSPMHARLTQKVVERFNFLQKTIPANKLVQCNNHAKNDAAYYKVPVAGIFYNLEYIISLTSHNYYHNWHEVPSCKTSTDEYEAHDLLFNFGARAFLPLEIQIKVNVDGNTENQSLILAYVSTAHSEPFIRRMIGEDIPYFGFIAAELAKMYQLRWTSYLIEQRRESATIKDSKSENSSTRN